MADLARRLDVSPASITQMVSRYEARGLLVRESIKTEDGRPAMRIIIVGEEPPDRWGNWGRTHWHDSVLAAVRALGPMATMREIAARIECSPPWVWRLLDDLETAGEIERPGPPGTRRPIRICDE